MYVTTASTSSSESTCANGGMPSRATTEALKALGAKRGNYCQSPISLARMASIFCASYPKWALPPKSQSSRCSKQTRHLPICVPVGSKEPLCLRLELAVWDSEQTPAWAASRILLCSIDFTTGDLCYAAYETWSTTPLARLMASSVKYKISTSMTKPGGFDTSS